ncbi:MAG: DUF3450 domain-containing protein [Maricaulaceae bacterium]
MNILLTIGRASALAALGVFTCGVANAQLNQAIQVGQQSTSEGAQTQERIDGLDDEADALARQYRAVLQQIERVRLNVDQQRVFLQSQQNEIESLIGQIDRVEEVESGLLPMMQEMVERLGQIIDADLPFLVDERADRFERVQDALDDPDQTPAERYRQIVNAFQIEESYGRQVTAYDEKVTVGGETLDVEILRVGRVSMIYRDRQSGDMGIYNKGSQSWDPLDGSYRLDIQKALRIAKELTTPDVFLAPTFGPTTGQ